MTDLPKPTDHPGILTILFTLWLEFLFGCGIVLLTLIAKVIF